MTGRLKSGAIIMVVAGLAAGGGFWYGKRQSSEPGSHTALTAASSKGGEKERKILYYRNPMGLPDTSPTPKKDPMGMDYIPVYAGEQEQDAANPTQIRISTDKVQKLGVRVFAIPDGDVAASILTCMPDSEVDVLYGIGGAPEGVVSAAVIRALDGDMQARLLPRHEVKGDSEENRRIGENELARCEAMGIEANKVLALDEMARSDNVVFSATGITKGDLLDGITRKGNMATTETLLIRGKSRTIRRIQSIHYLDRKDPDVQTHIL